MAASPKEGVLQTLAGDVSLQWGSESWCAAGGGYKRLYTACANVLINEILDWFILNRDLDAADYNRVWERTHTEPRIPHLRYALAQLRSVARPLRKPKGFKLDLRPKAVREINPWQLGGHVLLGTVRQNGSIYFSALQPYLKEIDRCPHCRKPTRERGGELACLDSACGWTTAPMVCPGQFPDPNYKVVWAHPQTLKPEPKPPEGSERYRVMLIPKLRGLGSKTRSEASQHRIHTEFLKACAERKQEFRIWNRWWLRLYEPDESKYKGSDALGHPDKGVKRCPRCGCSFFNRYFRCHDCKLKFFSEWDDVPTLAEREVFQKGSPDVISDDTNKRRRRSLTPKQFVAGLVLRGQVKKLRFPKELRKAVGSYVILVEQWLPKDVQKFLYMTDPEPTIQMRADRIYDDVQACLDVGTPLPELTDLSEHLDAESLLRLKTAFEDARTRMQGS